MSRRKGIMLCYPLEERRLLGQMQGPDPWSPPFYCQPKLDGIRCRAVPNGDEYLLLTSEENIIFSMPHIEDALNKAKASGVTFDMELDGELYCHGMSFEDTCSIVLRDGIHPTHQMISFNIFDVCLEETPQSLRSVVLKELSPRINQPLRVVETEQNSDMLSVMESFDRYVFLGYEGIIVRERNGRYVRRRSTSIMKFKPHQSDTYDIVDYKQEISIDGVPKGRLGSVVCITDGDRFSVGSGFSDIQRHKLWAIRHLLIGGTITVKYQALSEKHIPRFPIALEVFPRKETS